MPSTVAVERRYELAAARVTLDGEPAQVVGVQERFATVRTLRDSGPSHQWAWSAVEFVVTKRNGAFRSG